MDFWEVAQKMALNDLKVTQWSCGVYVIVSLLVLIVIIAVSTAMIIKSEL